MGLILNLRETWLFPLLPVSKTSFKSFPQIDSGSEDGRKVETGSGLMDLLGHPGLTGIQNIITQVEMESTWRFCLPEIGRINGMI